MTDGHSPYGPGPGGYGHGAGGGAGHGGTGYGPHGHAGAPPPPPHGHGFGGPPPATPGASVVSLVLGIMSFCMCGCLAGIPAIISGHMALGRYRDQPYLPGRGMAVVGLVLGYVSCVLTIVGIIVYLIFFAGSMML